MKKISGSYTGILGTVIIHLIAGIIFMSVQLNELRTERSHEFQMELAPEEIPEAKPDQKSELKENNGEEKADASDKAIQNIARNLSDNSPEKINREEYIDRVKDELIKSGKLGKDNYIDEQKRLKENKEPQEDELPADKKNIPEKDQGKEIKPGNYRGPTRIYYDLMGRTEEYLPVPVYKCQGSGKISMNIDVDQNGKVISASVIPSESTTSDPCLTESAVGSALESKFTADVNAPRVQRGTLTFVFVAQ
jgi:hypothetical protein